MRYHVNSSGGASSRTVDAFKLMVFSQRQQIRKLPRKKEPPRNQKDKRFNDLIDLLEAKQLFYSPAEAESSGHSLVKVLTDLLWHIDGHHATFSDQSCVIPSIFANFSGYNVPERSKHRKRKMGNLSSDPLKALSHSLFSILQGNYWKRPPWQEFCREIEALAGSISQYVDYLDRQNKEMTLKHMSEVPVRSITDSITVPYVKATTSTTFPLFREVDATLAGMQEYEYAFLNDLLPDEPRKRYNFLQSLLRTGIQSPIVVCTHSPGNNAGNLHFVWRVPKEDHIEKIFSQSQHVIETVRLQFPVFHIRAMRKTMFSKFGRIAPSVKPSVLRYFYCDLTGDATAANDMGEAEVDERVLQFLQMEPDEPSTVTDLREVKHPEHKTKYDVFWNKAEIFLNEDIGTAVDDRRHSQVTHLAKAISISDFREQVEAKCPEGAPIPSDEWLRLQFWPKTPKAGTALHYTGRLKVRYMVQARQFRKTHVDENYAAALFRYLREFAVQFRSLSKLVCLDDKHRMKIGEPGFPVVAAERGRRVLVKVGASFEVGNHDFTKFSMIPSVVLQNQIPEDVTSSWYRSQIL